MAGTTNSGGGDDDSGGKLLVGRYLKGENVGEGTYGIVNKAIDNKITYGAPKERVPLLNLAGCGWSIALYIMPRPGYKLKMSKGATQPTMSMEEVALTDDGQLPPDYVLKDPDSHFIYVCHKLAANGASCRDADPEETANAN